jgi:tetratricopeptide (TPR) repeat protein
VSNIISAASKVYYDAGKIDTALQIILEGLRISPNDARLHHRAGMILKDAKELPKAKEHLEQASKDPTLGYSIIALADVYLELGEIKEADEIIEKFPGSKQKNPSYLTTKANILRKQNDFKNAEILLKKAIKLQPKDIMPYGLMATVKLEKGKLLLSNDEKELAQISFLEAKKYILDCLTINSKDESLLSIQHELGKYI